MHYCFQICKGLLSLAWTCTFVFCLNSFLLRGRSRRVLFLLQLFLLLPCLRLDVVHPRPHAQAAKRHAIYCTHKVHACIYMHPCILQLIRSRICMCNLQACYIYIHRILPHETSSMSLSNWLGTCGQAEGLCAPGIEVPGSEWESNMKKQKPPSPHSQRQPQLYYSVLLTLDPAFFYTSCMVVQVAIVDMWRATYAHNSESLVHIFIYADLGLWTPLINQTGQTGQLALQRHIQNKEDPRGPFY